MIVDTSALLAVLFGEPDAAHYERAIAEATREPLLFKGRDFALTDVEAA